MRVALAAWLLVLVASGCSDSASDCPDGIRVGDLCLPHECTDRDCPEGFVCLEGKCAELACLEVTCGPGQACAAGDCYPEDCDWRTCPGLGEVCVEEDCLPASCVGVSCPPDQSCANGRCYPLDCPTQNCPGYGEVCIDGVCTERSCAGVTCPSGQRCAGGYCFPADCSQTGCYGEGEVCVDGSCVRRSCVHVECEPGHSCANGWCHPENCLNEDCSHYGEVCYQGACIPADCVGVQCPPGERCAHGDCHPVDCDGSVCADDEVCFEDRCVNWNCVGVQCPPAHRCVDGDCQEAQCPVPCTQDNQCQEADCGGFLFTCLANPVTGQPSWSEFGDTCTDGDPCTGPDTCTGGACTGPDVVCDNPPPDTCDGVTRVSYPATGNCAGGMCHYPETRQDCQVECLDGQCTGDPCTGVSCAEHEHCEQGACLCDTGWADCSAGEGCETALGTLSDCTDCGDTCGGGTECADPACDGQAGCALIPVANGTECGSRFCTGLTWKRRTCSDGTCSGEEALDNCDDGEFCTNDDCSASGCSNPRKQNGTPCGSTFCQGGEYRQDSCQGGSCSGYVVIESCDPNESCVEGTGCLCGGSGMNCAGSDANYCCTNNPAGCYNVTSNAFHCGHACEVCGDHMGCQSSQCVCHLGYADCTAADGCETHIVDNPNCGMCGRNCADFANDRACYDAGGTWRCGCYDDFDCDVDFVCGADNRCRFFP